MIEKFQVALIGGGVTGLMTAFKLTEIGIRVALIERQPALASGPSTRNEGWLHRGTYHASSIRDRQSAIQVARRCIYGHEQIRRFCPEAIEGADNRPIALLRDRDRIDEIVSRWDAAGVQYRPMLLAEAESIVNEADFESASAIFEVDDVSLNTRLLYRKLFNLTDRAGCTFYLNHKIENIDGQSITLDGPSNDRSLIEADMIVYAAGVGTREILRRYSGIDLPMRYWKSHLVVTKRLAPVGVFYLDPQEAAMMHHGDVSIIGFNEDALLCNEPSYDVIPARASNLHQGVKRIFPGWDTAEKMDVACVKVDFVADPHGDRSLNIAIHEPVPGHIVVLPGKLTETPFLTDVLSSHLHDRLDNPSIALRPCDQFKTELASRVA